MSATVSTSTSSDTRLPLGMSPPSDQQERESARRIRTLLDLLTTDKTDGPDCSLSRPPPAAGESGLSGGAEAGGGSGQSKWRILRERLGLHTIGCCGCSATWRYGSSPPPSAESNNDQDGVLVQENQETETEMETRQQSTGTTMNLAAALAEERRFRAAAAEVEEEEPPATPMRVSLMRLLEETTDGCDLERIKEMDGDDEGGVEGEDGVCCVCMVRKKGAAMIPCGHTYCRVCSREVWVNRGCCPLCNRPILEILDIF